MPNTPPCKGVAVEGEFGFSLSPLIIEVLPVRSMIRCDAVAVLGACSDAKTP